MEMQIVFAIFVILHGLVHMWYVTLSQGWVEFQVEMGWNGRSWLLTDALGEKLSLNIASVLYVLSTLLFIITGVALLAKAPWARVALIVSSIVSAIAILVFWDGKPNMLIEKGLIGFLINIGILILVYVTSWITF